MRPHGRSETGYLWTFLREARHPELIQPGATVIAGEEDAPAVAEVIDIVVKPAGHVVHLRLFPGTTEDYEALFRRTIQPPDPPAADPRRRPGERAGLTPWPE